MQNDQRPMLGRKAGQGAVQRVTVSDESKRIDTAGRREVRERHLDDAPLSAAGFVDGRVHEQAVEPGVEPVGIAQPRQVSPGPDQALLDRVARELGVPEDEASGRVHARSGARASTANASRSPLRACSTSVRLSTVVPSNGAT